MQPRIQELLAYLVSSQVHLRDAVAAVPREWQETRPGPDRWSVAEVLEHLALVETKIARLINRRVAEGRAAGVGPEQNPRTVLWTLDAARVLNRREPVASPEFSHPRGGLGADAAWEALSLAHEQVREAVIAADGLALGEISHPHSDLGPLDLYQWIAFTATHELRHVAQIREIGETLKRQRA